MAEETSKHPDKDYETSWGIVKNELLKSEASANKMAILETEKIFRKALLDRNLPGKDIEDKIESYAHVFSNHDKLKYSRAMYKKIIDKLGFNVSENDTKEIIIGYRNAIMDLRELDFKKFPPKEKIRLFLKRNFYSFPKKAKAAISALIILSVATFILTETENGREISSYLVSANNYIFYRIIPAIITVAAFFLIVIGILYAYQKKDK